MPAPEATSDHGALLPELARRSIAHGLEHGTPLEVDPSAYPEPLRRIAASFVTLIDPTGQLRGCIGSLEAGRPLVEDVVQNAFAAAFRDPRFAPLQARELEDLRVQVSVLDPAEPLTFETEADLLAQLQPHRDGLIIEQGSRRATFLPSVWELLPDRHRFLQELKHKAGISGGPVARAWRYRTRCYGD